MFLKRDIRTQMDLMRPEVSSRVAMRQARQKQDHDSHAREREYRVGDSIMATDAPHDTTIVTVPSGCQVL